MAARAVKRAANPVLKRRSPLSSASVVAFAATQRPKLAMQFYRDTLGLKLKYDDQFALVFDSNGTTIRVAIAHEVVPAGYTVLGWTVSDISATVSRLAKAGVEFARYPGLDQDETGVWDSPSGARVAWFHDPDGNTLSLTEL